MDQKAALLRTPPPKQNEAGVELVIYSNLGDLDDKFKYLISDALSRRIFLVIYISM